MTMNELLLAALVYVCICIFSYTAPVGVEDLHAGFTLLVEPQYTEGGTHSCFLEYKDLMSASSRELKLWAKQQGVKAYSSKSKKDLQSILLSC